MITQVSCKHGHKGEVMCPYGCHSCPGCTCEPSFISREGRHMDGCAADKENPFKAPTKPGFYWAYIHGCWSTIQVDQSPKGLFIWTLGDEERSQMSDVENWGPEIVLKQFTGKPKQAPETIDPKDWVEIDLGNGVKKRVRKACFADEQKSGPSLHGEQSYLYRVRWSDADKEFIATCASFPSLSFLAANSEDAFKGIRGLIRVVLEDMSREGEEIPKP